MDSDNLFYLVLLVPFALLGGVVGYAPVFVIALLWNLVSGVWRFRLRARPRAEQPLADGPLPGLVVTLVHGTFARNAVWLRNDSSLCESIRSAFATQHPKFVPFRWSGGNSVSARHAGGAQLVESIKASRAQWPHARHIVIAHSHGGAVTLSALRDEAANRAVLGVICLSTPFLVAQYRPVSLIAKIGISWAPAMITYLMFMVPLAVLDRLNWMKYFEDSVAGGIFGWVSLGAFFFMLYQAPRWIRSRADKVMKRMKLAHLEAGRLLIIRAPADEASAALGAAQMLNFVVSRLWDGTSDMLESMVRGTTERTGQWQETLEDHRRLHLALSAAAVALAVGLVLFASRWDAEDVALLCGLGLFCGGMTWSLRYGEGLRDIMGFVGKFLLAFVAVPLPVLSALLAVPFGPELAVASLLLNVTAEATPPGKHEVWQMGTTAQAAFDPDADTTAPATKAGLAHSRAYNDPNALARINEWIRHCLVLNPSRNAAS